MELDEFYKLFINHGLKYTTDSRSIPRGSIFFALKGQHFNGNTFAKQALAQGAAYAVIDEDVGHDVKFIRVDNVLRRFQALANMQRRSFSIPVIAIAGSNGKTTTKNLIKAVLDRQYRTHVTKGNFNNHIGVPMTLLDMPQDTEIAVVEIGTNHPGEIRALCNILEPNYGIITNIGKEHLEGFGDLEAVAREESELYLYLRNYGGKAFVRQEDDWLMRMSQQLDHRILYSAVDVEVNTLVPRIAFTYKGLSCQTRLMGSYNLQNILAAIRIGEHFGVPANEIVQALEAYVPENNRSQWVQQGGHEILLDAYNANPDSMVNAIDLIAQMPQSQKVLVLGDMFEMGAASASEHQALIQHIQGLGLKEVYLLGEDFKRAAQGSDLRAFDTMEELCDALRAAHLDQAAILIKGSRGMRMEQALDAFPDN